MHIMHLGTAIALREIEYSAQAAVPTITQALKDKDEND
jgi:hypothetical protein